VNQPTYSRCVRPAAKAMRRIHVAVYRSTNGAVGTKWFGGEIVLLATTGRRSGRRRIVPLVALRADDAFAVVASNGGSDRSPDWWLNLQQDPRAEVECSGTRAPTWGVRASPEVETRLLARFARTFPHFEGYRRRTTRDLPVVLLLPKEAPDTRCAESTV
jgi:F420H(2)-dependent quinone reductase